MAAKILVNYPGSLNESAIASKKKAVADALGVCCEDVILLPSLSVTVIDLPDSLTKAREKADKEAAHSAETAAKEQAKAEADAAKAAAKTEKAHA